MEMTEEDDDDDDDDVVVVMDLWNSMDFEIIICFFL